MAGLDLGVAGEPVGENGGIWAASLTAGHSPCSAQATDTS